MGEMFPLSRQLDLEHHCHNPVAGLKENEFDKEIFPLSCGSNPRAGDPFGVVIEQGKFRGQKQF